MTSATDTPGSEEPRSGPATIPGRRFRRGAGSPRLRGPPPCEPPVANGVWPAGARNHRAAPSRGCGALGERGSSSGAGATGGGRQAAGQHGATVLVRDSAASTARIARPSDRRRRRGDRGDRTIAATSALVAFTSDDGPALVKSQMAFPALIDRAASDRDLPTCSQNWCHERVRSAAPACARSMAAVWRGRACSTIRAGCRAAGEGCRCGNLDRRHQPATDDTCRASRVASPNMPLRRLHHGGSILAVDANPSRCRCPFGAGLSAPKRLVTASRGARVCAHAPRHRLRRVRTRCRAAQDLPLQQRPAGVSADSRRRFGAAEPSHGGSHSIETDA